MSPKSSIVNTLLGLAAIGGGYYWWQRSVGENAYKQLRRRLHLEYRFRDVHYLNSFADPEAFPQKMWTDYFYKKASDYDDGYSGLDHMASDAWSIEDFKEIYDNDSDPLLENDLAEETVYE